MDKIVSYLVQVKSSENLPFSPDRHLAIHAHVVTHFVFTYSARFPVQKDIFIEKFRFDYRCGYHSLPNPMRIEPVRRNGEQ